MPKKSPSPDALEEGFMPMAEDITPLEDEVLISDILKDFFPEARPVVKPQKPVHEKKEPSSEPKAEKPHYEGHRARLKQRFLEGGAETLPDYELLELILFRALPRRDVKPLAKHLLKTFGSFAEVMAAPLHRLKEIDGMGESAAIEMKIIEAAAKRFAKSRVRKKEVLASWQAVIDYCRTAMAYELKEQFRLLFLDKRNQLIADEVQQTGTIDHTPVYPREVVKRALELSASAVILVHNHPSGDPTPSVADIKMTHQIIEIARPLGLEILDHIIVGKNGHASLKALGHM